MFERSKIPLNKWLLATHLMCASKKGIRSHQIHRMLGVTYKTAWFMTHRIREAMAAAPTGKLGRYATEFDFRWNQRKVSDVERSTMLASRIGGKRLMYRDSAEQRGGVAG